MASTTSRLCHSAVLLVAGCVGEPKDPPAPPHHDSRPTGLATPCTAEPILAQIHLLGDETADEAGRSVDVGDLDSDGCDEVLVASPWSGGTYGDRDGHSAVYVLRQPFADGYLVDTAFATFVGSGGLDYWGLPSGLLTATGQVVIEGVGADEGFARPWLFDLPTSWTRAPIPAAAADAAVDVPVEDVAFGIGANFLGACSSADGTPALCAGAINSTAGLPADYAGQVIGYALPIASDPDAVADGAFALSGDPLDRAEAFEGRSDLDGDGIGDLVVGAPQPSTGQSGRVAIVLSVPAGPSRLWDVADAVLTGVTVNASFGQEVQPGDLDGDGQVDVFVGAAFGDLGEAFVFLGPFTGERSADAAEYRITGGRADEWLGFQGSIADFDGSGSADLAVSAPWSYYLGAQPGRVLLWTDARSGTYDVDSAPILLDSGAVGADCFGMSMASGDFDGDGLADLAIGAPCDSTYFDHGGSATLVFGASL